MASVALQTNGVPATNGVGAAAAAQPSAAASSQDTSTQSAGQPPSQLTAGASQPQSSQQQQQPAAAPAQDAQQQQQQPPPSAQPAPRPRDIRTMELLLTAQGVTAYETRVPQMLLDFAYRHTSAVLSDALHLSADPYTSHAGARASAASGAAASVPPGGDAAVSANAVQLAIASRLAFQFRGGAGGPAAGGGPSKEWLLELARERNRVALPRVGAVEWGARLPSERFVLSGVSWGLRDAWAPGAADADDEEDEEEEEEGGGGLHDGDITMGDADLGEDVGGDGVEGGTMTDVFADDGMEDEEMGME